MKSGTIIVILAGIGIVVLLLLIPRSPSGTATEGEADIQPQSQTEQETSQDDKLDDILRKMESGELPPMQAVLQIRDFAEAHPENVRAQFTLGLMSMQTGQYEKAVERFDKVVTLDADYGEAYLMKARAHLALKDTAQARSNFNEALNRADEETRTSIEKELDQLELN